MGANPAMWQFDFSELNTFKKLAWTPYFNTGTTPLWGSNPEPGMFKVVGLSPD